MHWETWHATSSIVTITWRAASTCAAIKCTRGAETTVQTAWRRKWSSTLTVAGEAPMTLD